ncbi:hypothetical protein Tco_0442637 [Tanacetum coccineum]
MKSGLKILSSARQNSSRAAVSVNTARPIYTAYPRSTMNCKPQLELQEKGVIDSGCSRHMTRNQSYLSDYEEIDGRFVAFGGDPKGGKINGKDTECVVLSPDFKLLDENHVLLRVPRKDNMYSVDLKNIVPSRGLTYLFANATLDESNLWHRRWKRISEKRTKIEAKIDKTEHGNEKSVMKSNSKLKSQQKSKSKSQPRSTQVKANTTSRTEVVKSLKLIYKD